MMKSPQNDDDDNDNDDNKEDNQQHRNKNDLIIDKGFPVLNNFRIPTKKSTSDNNNNNNNNNKTNDKQQHQQQDDTTNELIPLHPFTTHTSTLTTIPPHQITNLLHDCNLAFTARAKAENDAYSSGATFFVPAALMTTNPKHTRCALEDLASDIFKAHVNGCSLKPGVHYDVERSGAEWWTLILDSPTKKVATKDEKAVGVGEKRQREEEEEDGKMGRAIGNRKTNDESSSSDNNDDNNDDDDDDDEVGMHFDADYGLEDQLPNYMLHPRVATVTYLSDVGVPTFIVNKRSPPPADGSSKASLNGDIDKGWLSCPKFGKHIAFDGRFLHGGPGEFFPPGGGGRGGEEGGEKRRKLNEDGDDKMVASGAVATAAEAASRETDDKDDELKGKRITFMVNVWLNHCPIDAELIDDDLCAQMKTTTIGKEKKDSSNNNNNNNEDDDDTNNSSSSPPPIPLFTLKNYDGINPLKQHKLKKVVNGKEPAGSELFVVGNREVTMTFSSSMKDCHDASRVAFESEGQSIELLFEDGALCLEVGDEVEDDDDEEEEEEEEKEE